MQECCAKLNNWVEISGTALASNYQALRNAAGEATEVLAVVKANAYGHGAELCAKVLTEAGAHWLGVTCAAEGERVRNAVGDGPGILIMSGFLPEDVLAVVGARLTPVIWTGEQVDWLTPFPGQRVHLEVDTGMGRQGVPIGPQLTALLVRVESAGLILDGVFTHFCSSEIADSPLTSAQQQRFEEAIAQVLASGLRPQWVHAGNSSTVDNPAQASAWLPQLANRVGAKAMVRTGIALYGFCLPIEGEAGAQVQPALQPVMTWLARVLSVRDLAAGDTVGYNATFAAERPMRVALLPVGYADGLRRELSSTTARAGGWAMIAGQRAPILGRISMNLTVVDVTAIAGVQAGDTATIVGEGISAEIHARLAGTIVYEIVCGVHSCG